MLLGPFPSQDNSIDFLFFFFFSSFLRKYEYKAAQYLHLFAQK